jgi:polyhydroxybutyrate depolymerase
LKKIVICVFLFSTLIISTHSLQSKLHAQDQPFAGVLEHDGQQRSYYAYIPSSYDGQESVPLMIALHPFASSGRGMAALTDFDTFAEENGFIVVYPDSLGFRWNDGRPLPSDNRCLRLRQMT